MADIKALLADPEFKTLSLEGQKKALGRLDPELGGLSDSGFLKFVYQVAPPAGTEKLLGGLSSPLGAPLDPLKPPVLPRSGSPFVQDLNQEPVRHTPSAFRAYPGRAGSQTPFPDPVQDWIGEGMRKMGEGAVQVGSPGQADTTPSRQIMGGTSKMFRGGVQAATPFLLPGAAVTAPGALLLGAPTAMALGSGAEAGLNAMGVSPEKSAFGGDVGSIVGGILGGAMSKPVGSIVDAVRAGWDNPAIRKAAIREIPYIGPKAVRFMEALEPPPPKVYPTPGVTPQGRGIAGFPKPPEAPEPKVYPAPGVTPQGKGISGFPKPPAEEPFNPGPAPKPVFKTAPVEKPFSPGPARPPTFPKPPVEKPFDPGPAPPPRYKTAPAAEPPVPEQTGGVPSAVTELLEKLRAQQPPPREPLVPRGAAPGNAPASPIRPEQTNPAATPLPAQITPPPGSEVTPGSAKAIDMDYVRRIAAENGETPQKTMNRWLHEGWKDAYGVSKNTHHDLSEHVKSRYGVKSMTELTPEEALSEFHSLKNIAIRKGHAITPPE